MLVMKDNRIRVKVGVNAASIWTLSDRGPCDRRAPSMLKESAESEHLMRQNVRHPERTEQIPGLPPAIPRLFLRHAPNGITTGNWVVGRAIGPVNLNGLIMHLP